MLEVYFPSVTNISVNNFVYAGITTWLLKIFLDRKKYGNEFFLRK